MTKAKKLFLGAVALEITVSLWLGIEIAMATEKPWARQPKPSKLPGTR